MARAAPAALAVLIVDDEDLARARLRDLLADIAAEAPTEVVGEAANGVQALAELESRQVDVLLVDIRMPVMDGLELVRHLSRLAKLPAVIFVTAFDSYAVQAFDVNAVDYLLKPVRAQRLLLALQKVQQHGGLTRTQLDRLPCAARSHLSCHERGRLLLIPVSQVLYLRAGLKYVAARTRDREYVLDESLTQLESEFGEQFMRLHRSVLVARKAIAGFEKTTSDDAEAQWQAIVREVPERLPVSRRQWPLVRAYARRLTW